MNQNKMIMHQVKYSRGVMHIGRVNAESIAKKIQDLYGRGVIDAESIKAQILNYCDLLGVVTDEFSTASRTVSREVTEDFLARGHRDDVGARIKKILSTGRSRVRDNLGEDAIRMYKLDQRTPMSQEALGTYATEVLDLLQQQPRTAEDVLGGTFRTADLVAALEPAVAEFQTRLDEVSREERETQKSRYLRNQIEERFRTVLVNVASIIEAHLRMVGLDALADRIRPNHARASGEVEVDIPEASEASKLDNTEPGLAGNTAQSGNTVPPPNSDTEAAQADVA